GRNDSGCRTVYDARAVAAGLHATKGWRNLAQGLNGGRTNMAVLRELVHPPGQANTAWLVTLAFESFCGDCNNFPGQKTALLRAHRFIETVGCEFIGILAGDFVLFGESLSGFAHGQIA